jgi:hypothetical protein
MQNSHNFAFLQENVQIAAAFRNPHLVFFDNAIDGNPNSRAQVVSDADVTDGMSLREQAHGGRRLVHDWHSRKSQQMQQYVPSHTSRLLKQRFIHDKHILQIRRHREETRFKIPIYSIDCWGPHAPVERCRQFYAPFTERGRARLSKAQNRHVRDLG